MSFEPHLYQQPEDHRSQDQETPLPVDLELPEDLEILGQQLSDDASYLAACYPAGAQSPVAAMLNQNDLQSSKHSPHTSQLGLLWRRRWISIAASLLVIVASSSFYFSDNSGDQIAAIKSPHLETSIATSNLALPIDDNKTDEKRSTVNNTNAMLSGFNDTLMNANGLNQVELFAGFVPSFSDLNSDKNTPQLSPAYLLFHLSAPEQEAFMDLLKDDEQGMYEISL